MISGKNVSLKYHTGSPVLKDLSFHLKKGRITTFMGPSGAGKTTLLKCITQLNSQYEGVICFEDINIKTLTPEIRASKIGFVHQQYHLFPHLTVLQNCTYALTIVNKISNSSAEKQAKEILETLGIDSLIHMFPAKISGGQQQRVAIARALILRPEVLLLDEPTSALDPESKKSLEILLLELNRQGFTIALSSHDMAFINKIKDFIYFLEKGQIIETWDKNIDQSIQNSKIKQFLFHEMI